ncbi:MAG: purine-nucleoside phosphorylase [Lentisphaerae bacterium]|jgi:purine-nucleoside phosphorylase|nr:purine-nucleoside phosphorylase [Lentisphaerota bacterium]
MPAPIDPAMLDQAARALPPVFRERPPACGIILGSGWSQSLAHREVLARVPYGAIPGLGASSVVGHAGELLLFEQAGKRVAAFCGRHHWYEGAGWTPVALPVELLRRLGAARLVLTNAAGGVNPSLGPGDLLLIRDHINTTGLNPLQGPVIPGWGPRFPDQSHVYAPALCDLLLDCAERAGIPLREGIYAFTSGPCFETPAEIRAYAGWGVDAVGMSTVPEALLGNAMGLEVAAVSCITNRAAGIGGKTLTHDEVLEATAAAAPRMRRLIEALLDAV